MSWSPIEPPALGAGTRTSTAVTLSLLADSKRYAPAMRLVIRTDRIAGADKWLRHGSTIAVLAGHGDHAGRMRLTRDGGFLITNAGGRGKDGTVALRLPVPKGVTLGRKHPTPCEIEHGEGWLEFVLPTWARTATNAAPPARHIGISERIADPTTALRGRA